MGNMGIGELLIIIVIGIIIIMVPIILIYKYGKLKGRLKELENRIKEK